MCSFWINEGTDIHKQGLIHVKSAAEEKCQNTLTKHMLWFCQRFSESRKSYILLEKIKGERERENLEALFCKNIQLGIAKSLCSAALRNSMLTTLTLTFKIVCI